MDKNGIFAFRPKQFQVHDDVDGLNWSSTDSAYKTDLLIHQLFEAQVEATPNKIFIKDGAQSVTYQLVNERANQLAGHLVCLGVKANQLVGLFAERSIETLIGIVAILKAGGAYVPIDPKLPADRIRFMLADANLGVVLTDSKWVEQLPSGSLNAVCLDRLPAEVEAKQKSNLGLNLSSESLAYLIYTSGSTGTPKGAMISHRNLHNYVHGRKQAGIYTADDVFLHGSTLSFDIAVEEIFCPMVLGGQIVLLGPVGFKDIDLLLETVQQQSVTVLTSTPSVLEQCLDSVKLMDCHQLRTVVSGGEALTVDLARRWLTQTNAKLINSYGPTETTVDVTTHICSFENLAKTIPIGRPSANCLVHILDENLKPVPLGEQGEIFIGGDAVGKGYWNRPELTAERFLTNPFAAGKLYKTGDLGRFLPNGEIEFLGRRDHQVKVRGFRIELGEIEAALRQHSAVDKAVVLAKEISSAKQLVAYAATAEHQNRDIQSELWALLVKKLPKFMMPKFLVLLPELPLMISGKLDLQSLPEPGYEHGQTADGFMPPQTENEKRLAAIWQDALQVGKVGLNDNFFDLGGHSLLVAKVLRQTEAVFGVSMPMQTFFDTPVLADQVVLLEFLVDSIF